MGNSSSDRVSAIVRCPEKRAYEKREYSRETLDWAEGFIGEADDYMSKMVSCTENLTRKVPRSEVIQLHVSNREAGFDALADDVKAEYVDPMMFLMDLLRTEVEAKKICAAIELAELIDPDDEKEVGYVWNDADFIEALKPKSA